ncbi:hypothetical protein [Aliiroseovarius sp. S253]|uniref:hypothetical protein n=1 Tax=Aliiroseovarius sp. S253 TaxID=3415133 RepID=UPI003C79BC4D
MKTIPILLTISMLALSACNPATQEAMKSGIRSGVALEAYAAKSSFGMKRHQDRVAASPAVVSDRLARFARECVNGRGIKVEVIHVGIPRGGPANKEILFQSRITNEDGTPRLIIAQQNGGAVLHLSEGSKGYNVQLSTKIQSDGAGGTLLTTTRNISFGAIFKEALKWASGQTTTCKPLIKETVSRF